jgi:hypothetical protein
MSVPLLFTFQEFPSIYEYDQKIYRSREARLSLYKYIHMIIIHIG